jgi:hypothetical protein
VWLRTVLFTYVFTCRNKRHSRRIGLWLLSRSELQYNLQKLKLKVKNCHGLDGEGFRIQFDSSKISGSIVLRFILQPLYSQNFSKTETKLDEQKMHLLSAK